MTSGYEEKTTANARLHKRLRKRTIFRQSNACIYCPPGELENRTRKPKHPVKKSYQLSPKRRHK